jgi:hypothetical protein
MRDERSDGIMYVVEVATEDARCEHRFERFDDARRYANDVQRLNPDVEVGLFFDAEGWLAEYRRDVWLEEGCE